MSPTTITPPAAVQRHRDNFLLDGVVRPVSDAFWRTHYPPNGWGCRCEAIQLPGGSEAVTQSVPDVPVPAMFRTNLAQTGVIFPKNHLYYKWRATGGAAQSNTLPAARKYLPNRAVRRP